MINYPNRLVWVARTVDALGVGRAHAAPSLEVRPRVRLATSGPMNGVVVLVMSRLCSCCLDLGRATRLWLVRAGIFTIAYCPMCDGQEGD